MDIAGKRVEEELYNAMSQTPFGFGGGLDFFQMNFNSIIKIETVSNAFRLWGRVGCVVMSVKQQNLAFVSNAFRLWGRVGFLLIFSPTSDRFMCLKRLSALGAGWICDEHY